MTLRRNARQDNILVVHPCNGAEMSNQSSTKSTDLPFPDKADSPIWLLAFDNDTDLAGDDQLPAYLQAFTDEQLAEYGRSLSKQKDALHVIVLTWSILQQLVEQTPTVEGLALVFDMGPLVPWRGKKAREVKKAYIKRAAFLSMTFSTGGVE
jgi:hypothetical protein